MNGDYPTIIKYIRARLWRHDQNFVCAIVGETGTAKSTVALSLAFAIDKTFEINRDIFWSSQKFSSHLVDTTTHRGKAYVLDEIGAGEGWAAREFMKKENKQLSYLFQTFRMLNCCIIMTVPCLAMLDKHGRNLSYAVIKTTNKGIDRINKINRVVLKRFQTDPITGKDYHKYLRIQGGVGERKKMRRLSLAIPSESHIRLYKKIAKVEKHKIFENVEKNISGSSVVEEPEVEAKDAHCNKCGHDWAYKGKALCPHCPSCGSRCKPPINATT